MTQPVSFKIAKLLKEKGFDQKATDVGYKLNGDKCFDYAIDRINRNGIAAPTIAEVVMWIYENHGIWITVTSKSQESWQCHMTKKGDFLGNCYLEDFYTPTEAYKAGIEYTLNNLIQNNDSNRNTR